MANQTQQPRRIRVAAVQIQSVRGDTTGNLSRATELIERAAARRARLVVLPELHATGYDGTRGVWDVAETADGAIAQWVAATAGRLGIYLGCGMVERAGTDCFNACVWAGPDGTILGVIRKANAEGFAFRRDRGVHVIESPIGTIGVGICADNRQASLVRLMAEKNVDLVVMPHAAPMLTGPSRFGDETEVAAQHERMKTLPMIYARALGVPVIFANAVGSFGRIAGLYGSLMRLADCRLLGLSGIVDSDGQVVSELGTDEGLAVADVVLDATRKRFVSPPEHAGMLFPVPAVIRWVLLPVDIRLGKLSYWLRTPERRRRFEAAPTADSNPSPYEI